MAAAAALRSRLGLSSLRTQHPTDDPSYHLNQDLGLGLLVRYEDLNEADDLDLGICLLERAVDYVPPQTVEAAAALCNLGNSLACRFRRNEDMRDLHQAIDAFNRSLQSYPPDAEDFPRLGIMHLASDLMDRYERTGDSTSSDQSIQLLDETLDQTPEHSPVRARLKRQLDETLHNLAVDCFRRCETIRDPVILDRGIQAIQRLAQTIEPSNSHFSVVNNDLAAGLFQRYELSHSTSDLEWAVELFKAANTAMTQGTPESAHIFKNLYLASAVLAFELFQEGPSRGERTQLDRAYEITKWICAQQTPESPSTAHRLHNLAWALIQRFENSDDSDVNDLDFAFQLQRAALEVLSPAAPEYFVVVNNYNSLLNQFSRHLLKRHEDQKQMSDLDRAISLLELGVTDKSVPNEMTGTRMNNLGVALARRAEATASIDDLRRATELGREALKLALPDELKNAVVKNLTSWFRDGYSRTTDLYYLNHAIQLNEQNLSTEGPGHPLSGLEVMVELTELLGVRYGRLHDVRDMERAVEIKELIHHNLPNSTVPSSLPLCSLNEWRDPNYAAPSDTEGLDRAIIDIRYEMHDGEPGSPNRQIKAGSLGLALYERYLHGWNLADLRESITLMEEALAIQCDLPQRTTLMNTCGIALVRLFERTLDVEIIWRAIDLLGDLISESEAAADHYNNLAAALTCSWQDSGYLPHLHDAIELLTKAIGITAPGSHDLIRLQLNLWILKGTAAARMARLPKLDTADPQAAHTKEIQAAQTKEMLEAIEYVQRAIETLLAESVERAVAYNALAHLSLLLYRTNDDQTHLAEALQAFHDGCNIGLSASPELVLIMARNWLVAAFRHSIWVEIEKAYDFVEKALEIVLHHQSDRPSKEIWLRAVQGLSASAAYALHKLRNPRAAALVLEWGRARLLSEPKLPTMTGGALLKHGKRDFAAISAAIKGLSSASSPNHSITKWLVRWLGSRSKAAAAIVYLAAAPEASVAIIVTRSAVTSYRFPLPEWLLNDLLLQDAGTETSIGYLGAAAAHVREFSTGAAGDQASGYLGAQFEEHNNQREALESLLSWSMPVLGSRLMLPLANALRKEGICQVILIPSGRLGLLPLHAAQYHRGDSKLTFSDEFLTSYAPSARTILAAQQLASSRAAISSHFLGVSNPLPHPAPLRAASAEVKEIAALFHPAIHDIFDGLSVSRDLIIPLAGVASHLHFACHGHFDPLEPMDSGLDLGRGERLKLGDLLQRRPRLDARLAVLSACQSALVNFGDLPDEYIGLPAAFIQAGVPGVIGTLWEVDDVSTAIFMVRFYELCLRNDPQPLPFLKAFCVAQRWLRQATQEELSSFMNRHRGLGDLYNESLYSVTAAPESRPFADRPYQWAPFVFVGV